MYLPDHEIKMHVRSGILIIDPYDPSCIQPASYDLHLGAEGIDIYGTKVNISQGFVLPSQGFALFCTQERIKLPNNIVGELHGKSGLARKGLMVHITAGFVDPGWDGVLTLELFNVSKMHIILEYGMPIAQIGFNYLHSPSEFPYGSSRLNSHYQGATGVEGSKI